MYKISFLFSVLLWLFSLPALAQYVPKDKREQPKDTIKKVVTPKPTNTRTEPEPLEQKFIAYAMAFPSFLPNTFTPNGGNASLNVAYRFSEKFNMGITTNYSYQNFNNFQTGGGFINASIRTTGVGLFAQYDINQNYFIWGEYINLYLKVTDRAFNQVDQSWYSQPLIGAGGKLPIGDGRRGFASMILLNPRALGNAPVLQTPYPMFVTRFLYYFTF